MHAILTEAAPKERLPALGGPVALGIWLAKKFPDDHSSVAKGRDVRGMQLLHRPQARGRRRYARVVAAVR